MSIKDTLNKISNKTSKVLKSARDEYEGFKYARDTQRSIDKVKAEEYLKAERVKAKAYLKKEEQKAKDEKLMKDYKTAKFNNSGLGKISKFAEKVNNKRSKSFVSFNERKSSVNGDVLRINK